MRLRGRSLSALFLLAVCSVLPAPLVAQDFYNPLAVHVSSRIAANVEDGRLQLLRGNRPPLARAEFDAGAVAAGLPLEKMVLVLQSSPEQQAALEALLEQQRDPASPNYRRWLTPDRFAEHFGASAEDVQRIESWLRSNGMRIDEVAASRRSITFSGTAAQVERAFSTRLRRFRVRNELHIANATEPSIPAALAPVVNGVLSLHDFRPRAMHSRAVPVPQVTSGGTHYLSPADLATIYNVQPLYSQGINGSGQSVAVVARSNIFPSDVAAFRSTFGLPVNAPQVIVNGSDPGTADYGELVEATLDAEYAGALAPSATVKFVTSASTNVSDGTFLSAQYIVNQNLAPVLTMSFGLCEAEMGASGNAFVNALWQQAASEGITVLVSAGDSGAAGCDCASSAVAQGGLGVNALCSTPYDLCIGGTQFNDTGNPSLYWSASNTAGTMASALGYVPEVVWNESGADLWAGGGGSSSVYAKPVWQSGMGVPSDGHRDVPDLSLAAAGHDGYLIVIEGSQTMVGGTSAASPSLAGIFALAAQSAGARLGLANPNLYTLAGQQNGGGAAVFHDVTGGSNSVPGLTGFNATAGYDPASGLGSVDAAALVNNWGGGQAPAPAPVGALKVTVGKSSIASVIAATSIAVKVAGSHGFSGSVNLAASGLPSGIAAAFSPSNISAPGTGNSTLQLTVDSTVAAGSYKFNVSASGGGLTSTAAATLTVIVPTLTFAASAASVSVPPGTSASIALKTVANAALISIVVLNSAGLPAGVSASFTPATIPSPGSGKSTLTVTAASGSAVGVYTFAVTATAGSIAKSINFTLNVTSMSAAASASSLSIARGAGGSLTVTTSIGGGFNAKNSISVLGMPAGVTAKMSPAAISAPGAGNSTVHLSVSTSAPMGSASLTIHVSGGGIVADLPLSLTVTPQPTFSFAPVDGLGNPTNPAATVSQGGSATMQFASAAQNGFAAALALSVSKAPAGVTLTLSPTSISPGQWAALTIGATARAATGVKTVTVTARGGGLSIAIPVVLTVTH